VSIQSLSDERIGKLVEVDANIAEVICHVCQTNPARALVIMGHTMMGTCDNCQRIQAEAESKILAEQAERERLAKIRVRFEAVKANVPESFRGTFDISKVKPEAKVPAEKVLAWTYGAMGIIAHGATGKSKTWSLYELVGREIEAGRSAKCITAFFFTTELSKAQGEFKVAEYIDTLTKPDILFFDDLGQVKFSEQAEAAFMAIIDARASKRKPTLISTNYVGESLIARFQVERGEPVVRRIREFCTNIYFP
jgi:DNA replication protein DnaC